MARSGVVWLRPDAGFQMALARLHGPDLGPSGQGEAARVCWRGLQARPPLLGFMAEAGGGEGDEWCPVVVRVLHPPFPGKRLAGVRACGSVCAASAGIEEEGQAAW